MDYTEEASMSIKLRRVYSTIEEFYGTVNSQNDGIRL